MKIQAIFQKSKNKIFNSRLKLIVIMKMRFMMIKFNNNLIKKASNVPITRKTLLKKRLISKNDQI